MVVYYLNKVSEKLVDYRYPIKEGDICLLYDGEFVRTIYIDSETDADSVWRDFKFIDSKSLKSYQFPKTDSILCAPVGEKHAFGDTKILTQLIQECKGEWLLDFLNETSAVLSGFVDYWDLMILRRLTGDDNIEMSYGDEEELSALMYKSEEDDTDEFGDDNDDDIGEKPINYDIRWFCLSVMSCIEGQLEERNYNILRDMLKGDTRRVIAQRYNLTKERIRQIVAKATKDAKELLSEQHKELQETKAENAKLKVKYDLLREEIIRLRNFLPNEIIISEKVGDNDLGAELANLLETSLKDIALPIRAVNILHSMGVVKFADIPQLESEEQILKVRNSGLKTVHDISEFLEDFNLSFGMSITDIVGALKEYDWNGAKRKWMERNGNKNILKKNRKRATNKAIIIPKRDFSKAHRAYLEKEKATIELTNEIIEAARTPNGGFTKSQLAAIGIEWPPPQGWIDEKVGMMITSKQLENFNRIEYVEKPLSQSLQKKSTNTYMNVAFSADDRRRMKAVLQAMTHFYSPATPHDIARTISRSAWGDDVVNEDTVDSILKRLPEVEYVQWGKYKLKEE